MTPKPRRDRARRPPTPPATPSSARRGAVRWTRWLAYGAIVLYGLFWGIQAFTQHRTGNYGVETDFYWKYAPAADGLRHGRIDIANYDSKGWGYPAALALVSLLGLGTFHAGQLLALLAACAAAWLLYRAQRSLFGPSLALLGLLLLLSNEAFLTNTYQVGTDMFFFALCAASLALLLKPREPGLGAVAGAGLLAGWAFSTRYNGLFLWPAGVLQILFLREKGERGDRWPRVGILSAGFLVGALPWLVINALHTGNPLTNSNYMNVGYLVYGHGDWERFFYGHDRAIHSFLDVVRLDPGRFVSTVARNAVATLGHDLGFAANAGAPGQSLLPRLWGVFAVLGAALAAWERPGRRAVAFFLFGLLYFLTVTPVFYGARFSLPMLAFYTALAAWPFVSARVGSLLGAAERAFPLRSFVFLLLWLPGAFATYGRALDPQNPRGIRAGSPDMDAAVGYLHAHAAGQALVARKPHAAYRAGLRFVPLTEVASIDELRALMGKEHARYLLVSGWELRRPALAPFANPAAPHPGFRLAFESPTALVYETVPDSTAGAAP